MIRKERNFILPNGLTVAGFEDSQYIIDEIWETNVYERDFTITPGMTIIDIGANQGFFSLYAASKGAKVYAYEPFWENYKLLRRNIESTSFSNLIYAYNEAIGKVESSTTLYIPESKAYVSHGMVTLKKEIINHLLTLGDAAVHTQKVNQSTLNQAVERIDENVIDLIKMDCEGSEYDILAGATLESLAPVKALVMETHHAYKECDLYRQVQALGFNVIRFDKAESVYRNGYLFASRNLKNLRKAPVALLKSPKWVYQNQSCTLDASRSFSAFDDDHNLAYRYVVDGVDIGIHEQKAILVIKKLGPTNIKLSVEDEGYVDFWATQIICLPNDYHSRPVDIVISQNRTRLELSRFSRIKIPLERLPKNWVEDKIVISMSTVNGRPFPRGKFVFLTDEHGLSGNHLKIEIENIHVDIDLIFDIELSERVDIEFRWWPEPYDENSRNKRVSLAYDGCF
jgi:FkbM family methyltransferase